VDAWQLASWEAYRDVPRLGRKTRLAEKQRKTLWEIFSNVRDRLDENGLITVSDMFAGLARYLNEGWRSPYDFAVIDEAQDIGVAELRFLAALAAGQENGLFFAGDLGQRIFQTPFSWKSLGVNVRGRSSTLRINYRTSHQIRQNADQLLSKELSDVDGVAEDRSGTVSVFNGPAPQLCVCNTEEEEAQVVATWLGKLQAEGIQAHEVAVFVRSSAEIARAQEAVEKAGSSAVVLDQRVETRAGHIAIGEMALAKGLEFRAVAVMACDDEVIPLQRRIEDIADDADLEDVYNTERHLLYVACTRSRDHLLVTAVAPPSEFLDDLKSFD
jgi:superfamily I DNA/RNA helicase